MLKRITNSTRILLIRSAYLGDFIVIVPFINFLISDLKVNKNNIFFIIFNASNHNPVVEVFGKDHGFGNVLIINPQDGILNIVYKIYMFGINIKFDIVMYLHFLAENKLAKFIKFFIFKLLYFNAKFVGFNNAPKKAISQYDMPFYSIGAMPKFNHKYINPKYITCYKIGLYVSSKLDMKKWNMLKYINVVNMLNNTIKCHFFLFGSEDDLEYNREFLAKLDGVKITNLTAKLSVAQTINFMKKLHCLLSNDGSPIHMASLVNTKVVSLFTYKEPLGVWDPISSGSVSLRTDVLCKECYKVKCNNNICLSDITETVVFESVMSVLHSSNDAVSRVVIRGLHDLS